MKKHVFYFVGLVLANSLFSQNFLPVEDSFHFNVFNLKENSIISVAKLNEPITEKNRIKLSEDGHLVADGKRIRIFGTNLSEFPQSHKEAESFAQMLANQGYNCIRFHHTDATWTNCFLKYDEYGNCFYSEQGLDNFDYFFAELKKRGIYANINLLTGRQITSKDGFPQEVDKTTSFKSNHCLGFWNEHALNLQKEYASYLLNHVNPYTKIAYKDEPAVAIVEVNNENGLIQGYFNKNLDDFNGELWQELEDKWNEYLKSQNLNYEKLSSFYNINEDFSNILINSSSKWNLEQHQGAKANFTEKKDFYEIKIQENGKENWHIQFATSNLNIQNGKIYTLKFKAKASDKCKISVGFTQAHDPWKNGGFSKDLDLTKEWQTYEFTVNNLLTDENLRVIFSSMGFLKGKSIFIKDVSLVQGGNIVFVREGNRSTKDKKTVLLPHLSEYQSLNSEYQNLVLNFLWELEEKYWVGMRDYLKKEIGSDALLMGTSMGCSSTILQSCFDIIDTHAYWNHPVFGEVDWDRSNYYVSNKDLTKADSNNTLTGLAKYRVFGKPFSCTEYDHPYPNQYSSQMYPMLASYAAFQDWDCIFTFCSEIPKNRRTKINGFFDQTNNPSKSCAAPIASRIFRNFLVKPAEKSVYVNLDEKKERENLNKFFAWNVGNSEIFGVKPIAGLKYQIGIVLDDNFPKNSVSFEKMGDEILQIQKDVKTSGIGIFSDTKEIFWEEKTGIFIVNNDDVSISIFAPNANFSQLPEDWKKEGRILPLKNTSDFATFAAVRDGSKYLIFVCSWAGNKNEKLSEYKTKSPSNKNVLIRDEINLTTNFDYGSGPVLTLGINSSFEIFGNKKFSLYPVNIEGILEEPITKNANIFDLKRETQTLWYVLE